MILRKWHLMVWCCLWISSSLFANPAYMTLPNPELAYLSQAHLLGELAPDHLLTFTVWLKLKNTNRMDETIRRLYDPKSSSYQQFLTYDDIQAQFLPDDAVIEAVRDYFITHHARVTVHGHVLKVTGRASQIESMLHVKMNRYRYQERDVYANATPPSLESRVGQHVLAITGLNQFSRVRPMILERPDASLRQMTSMANQIKSPYAAPTATSLAGFSGQQLQTAYNLSSISPVRGTTIDGTGQTIVIVDFCGEQSPLEIMADANVYNAASHIRLLDNSTFKVVNPDGSTYTSSCQTTGWEGEIALDLESSHTVAPGANIALVLDTGSGNLEASLAEVIHTIMSQNGAFAGFTNARIITNSWGAQEMSGDNPLESSLQLAAMQGISVGFSTGDCGDNVNAMSSCGNPPDPGPGRLSVNYPASSPYVTAVGASSLFVDAQWNYAFESGWGSVVDNLFWGGSGGGISQYYALPSWQQSITNYTAGGYDQGSVGEYNHRALPDIGMLGDPFTGLLIYSQAGCSKPSGYCQYGGTSLASPLFAGTLALVNQARELVNGVPSPLGLAAPYLYTQQQTLASANAVHVITPPHQIIPGTTPALNGPLSAFSLVEDNHTVIFNWDSSLTMNDAQLWNDVVGVGSPNIPHFVAVMATL